MTSTPSNNTVYHLVMFSFKGSKVASDVLQDIERGQELEGYEIVVQAVVERDVQGNVHIHEPGHGGVGGTLGAVAGGMLGLLGGPMAVVALAVAGGTIGGIAGHFAGRAIPTEDLRRIGDALPPDSSALIVLAEDTEAEKVIDGLKGYEATIVTVVVGSELSGEIAAAVEADVRQTGAPATAATGTTATPTTASAAGSTPSTDTPQAPA